MMLDWEATVAAFLAHAAAETGLSRNGGKGAKGQGTLMPVKFAAKAPQAEAPVRMAVFSGVGEGNKLLSVPLPPPPAPPARR